MTRCDGVNGNAKLTTTEAHEFYPAFPLPMLLRPFVLRAPTAAGESTSFKLAALELGNDFMNNRPLLIDSEAKLTYMGEEPFPLGDKRYEVGKYLLEAAKKPYKVTIWSLPGGIILGMELDTRPGEQMLLVQYKKDASF